MKKIIALSIFLSVALSGHSQVQIGDDIDGKNAYDVSGHTVVLSGDGNTVAIGAIENSDGAFRAGQVRVFENVEGTWTQVGEDIYGEAIDDRSGWSLAISANGKIVAIGSDLNDGNGTWSGHVRIYENIDGAWTQIGEDIDGEAPGDVSGTSVSLSYDGSIVAIGAPRNNDNGENTGHVRVFQNIMGEWIQVGEDIDGLSVGERSGNAVALNGMGNIVAIGASQNGDAGSNSGAARVYEKIGDNWTQVGDDINGMDEFENSGSSIAISEAGHIIAIGSSSGDLSGSNSGHVRVFENTDGVWTQIGDDIIGVESLDFFGFSVALSASGDIVAIGAPGSYGDAARAGTVKVYKNIGGVWMQVGETINGEALFDESGYAIDISADGSIVAIGARFSDETGEAAGHARVFDLSTPLSLSTNDADYTVDLYPNPSHEIITISSENNALSRIEVYSITGELIFNTDLDLNTYTLNISNYSPGTYLLKMFGHNDKVITTTFLKR